ncbi:hypothetical protein SAMN05443662_0998 [Sulfurivirga caldicuralii]|uniref:Uncharacterized protein n=1 Tax=Sulfurivirga caldicuralii TaxID=364032 RepID=A0A1N6FAM3_9GAMM|nr:hypothetical protein [Sulfurivirga caldicuralii]SIN92292.1 hypothetical protein SAMN05443662_0998 [Sulfurivirga caldicuralii]
MTMKEELAQILSELPDDATWDDLLRELYRWKKITHGMSEEELAMPAPLPENELNAILGRVDSASSLPDDMRNTKKYNPGNYVTLGMVAGAVAIFFAMVFPPLSWAAAAVAAITGVIGVIHKEEKAWVPILLAMVSLVPMIFIFGGAPS